MPKEEWRTIPTFPKYGVSSYGRIETIKTGYILTATPNQQGHLKVNLMQDGKIYTRSVNQLVAKAFLPPPPRRDFTSIIHLNGDKADCHASNLMWRPRYFAITYHQQFETPTFRNARFPLVELKTGEKYDSIQDALVRHGLLYKDVLISAHERTYVWPTFQEFRHLAD